MMGEPRVGDLGDEPSSSDLSGLATKRPGAIPRLLAPCGRRAGVAGLNGPACVETDKRGPLPYIVW